MIYQKTKTKTIYISALTVLSY